MSVKKHYRGTSEYNAVFARLVKAAKDETTVTYIDLALASRLPTKGKYMADTISNVLREVTDECFNKNIPLLSCLVVRYDSELPGEGFFEMLKSSFASWDDAGFKFATDDAREVFAKQEMQSNYKYWS